MYGSGSFYFLVCKPTRNLCGGFTLMGQSVFIVTGKKRMVLLAKPHLLWVGVFSYVWSNQCKSWRSKVKQTSSCVSRYSSHWEIRVFCPRKGSTAMSISLTQKEGEAAALLQMKKKWQLKLEQIKKVWHPSRFNFTCYASSGRRIGLQLTF